MSEGKIVALDSPQELLARHGGSRIIEARPNSEEKKVSTLARLHERGFHWQEIENTLYIFQDHDQSLDDDLDADLNVLGRHVPTLEDVFLRLTGRSLGE